MPRPKTADLLEPYTPPSFFTEIINSGDVQVIPKYRLHLAHLPTPIQPFSLPELPEDVPMFIKRDDWTGGVELGGNKIRKLEFLLADAVSQGADHVVTAGGTQSNHCRATVAACRRLYPPIDCTLLLRTDSVGRNGNWLLDAMLGASMEEVPSAVWTSTGGDRLVVERCAELAKAKRCKKPYPIPVGGSVPLGAWGYVEFVREIAQQVDFSRVSDAVCSSGSGGTLAGLGLGLRLLAEEHSQQPRSRIQARSYCVCDTCDWFYDKVDELLRSMLTPRCLSRYQARDIVHVVDAKGVGYAKTTPEELQFICRVARETGVVFDSCYTGKALFGMWNELRKGEFKPSRGVLFVHTGGGASIFDHSEQLLGAAKP